MGTPAIPAGRDEVSGIDQRQSTRKVVSESVAVELQPGCEAWIRDVGEGGLSVSSALTLELGTSTNIRFDLPEADSVIDATGVVAWSDDAGRAGVRFTRVEPDSAAALSRWLGSGASTQASHSDISTHDIDLAAKVACLREVADLQAIISSEHLETASALDLVVRRMAELTRASGAAIALREGDDVFCRASFGNAPDVGVKLSSSSLSGECLRSGALVMLEDSENDPRVNPEICRQLSFRSLLIMPVAAGSETIGIAEVLSPSAHNFEGGDILVVSFLTDLVASIAAPRTLISTPDYASFSALPVIEPLPADHPESPDPGIARAVTPPASQKVSVRSAAANHDKEALPVIDRHHDAEKTVSIQISARGLRLSVIGVLVALVLLLLGYFYRQSRRLTKPVNPTPSTSSNVSPVSAASAVLPSTTAATSSLEPTTKFLRVARPTSNPATRNVAPSNDSTAPVELSVIQGHTVRAESAPDSAAPEPLAISALAPARVPSSLTASIAPPRPTAPELLPIQSQGVVTGKLIKKVLPQYPDMARRAGVSGDVVMSGIIGTDGALHNLKVVSGSPLLRDAAMTAATQWRYSPYMLGNKAVEAETHITVSFRH